MRPSGFRRQTIGFSLVLFLGVVIPLAVSAAESDLAFKSAGNGLFDFNTGQIKGMLRGTEKTQGIPSLIDVTSGREIAYNKDNLGLFSYYRLFSANKRWGDAARDWPRSAKLLSDGAVQLNWPPRSDHPVELIASYRWKSPNTLDLETTVSPQQDMPRFEVFLSSYFSKGFRSLAYVKQPLHTPGPAYFLSCDVNPFILGTYLAFPRDRRAAEVLFDGRWDYGPNPVHFSVGRFLAQPLCLKRDAQSGITCVLMSRPGDCFAIETPYNMDPPDGIAGHYSLYLSLFGGDIKTSQSARALTRLVVGHDISEEAALDLYQKFIAEQSQ